MPDLTEFLNARIGEDQATAEAAGGGSAQWKTSGSGSSAIIRDEVDDIVVYDEGSPNEEQAAHIARWDPARVLAECAAKRRLIDAEPTAFGGAYSLNSLRRLGILALPYADHPDFDETWRAE